MHCIIMHNSMHAVLSCDLKLIMPGQRALACMQWKQEEVLGHRHRKMF